MYDVMDKYITYAVGVYHSKKFFHGLSMLCRQAILYYLGVACDRGDFILFLPQIWLPHIDQLLWALQETICLKLKLYRCHLWYYCKTQVLTNSIKRKHWHPILTSRHQMDTGLPQQAFHSLCGRSKRAVKVSVSIFASITTCMTNVIVTLDCIFIMEWQNKLQVFVYFSGSSLNVILWTTEGVLSLHKNVVLVKLWQSVIYSSASSESLSSYTIYNVYIMLLYWLKWVVRPQVNNPLRKYLEYSKEPKLKI